jgi:hypothetical protein
VSKGKTKGALEAGVEKLGEFLSPDEEDEEAFEPEDTKRPRHGRRESRR